MIKYNPFIVFPSCIVFCIGLVIGLKWLLTGTVMFSSDEGNNIFYCMFIVVGFIAGVGGAALIMDGIDMMNKR